MSNKVLLAFAMKEELAPWRRRHRFSPVASLPAQVSVTSIGATEIYATLVGARCADTQWLDDFRNKIKPSVGIIAGVAAGLKPQWHTGDILVAHSVTQQESPTILTANEELTRLAMSCGAKPATLVTVPRIARTAAEKVKLANFGDAADMESFDFMRQCAANGIRSLGLRVILDPLSMPMTCDFESAMDSFGQVRIGKILAQLARHPALLPDFIHLARQSRRVLKILAEFLDQFLRDYDQQSRPPNQ